MSYLTDVNMTDVQPSTDTTSSHTLMLNIINIMNIIIINLYIIYILENLFIILAIRLPTTPISDNN